MNQINKKISLIHSINNDANQGFFFDETIQQMEFHVY